ncbi:MAG: hypothetical protein ABI151_14345, partial [Chitinophagaceae bacterium]
MKRSFYLLLLLVPVMMMSCQKEISLETGALPGDSTMTPPGTSNCQLSDFLEYDQVSGLNTYAYISTFNAEHKLVNLDVLDSSSGAMYGSFPFSYPAGKIQVDPQQYFVTGTDGKITEFHGYQDPENKLGSKVTAKYTYNAGGQLALKTLSFDSIPNMVALQYKFTYTGGNLVKQDVEFNKQGVFVRFKTADLTYDASKTVKSFINLYGGCPELIAFQTGITAGLNNVNPITKAVVSDVNFLSGNTLTVT